MSSGALLDDNVLLTAAHNYASPRAPFSFVRDRSVQCGTGVALAGTPVWEVNGGFNRGMQVRYPAGFRPYDWASDYALIAFGERAPQPSSFRLPRADEPTIPTDSVVFIAGFPSESQNTGSLLYHGRAKITSATDSELVYDLDTEKGLSGSPVWIQSGGDFVLVGIHVAEGRAHRLNERSLRDVRQWQQEFTVQE